MENIRLFIAIDIDKDGIDKIIPFQKKLYENLKEVRWTKQDTWHITLKFLGEVKNSMLNKIISTLEDLKGKFSPFTLELDKIDVFPDIRAPRVVFLDVKESPELKNLVELIDNNLFKIGFPKEKRSFRGHLTLGRIKDTKKFLQANKDYQKILNLTLEHKFNVNEFYLYRSELKKEGPQYTKLLGVRS